MWSFGIVLHELYTRGTQPYVGMDNHETAEKVLAGFRLPKPSKCPDSMYEFDEAMLGRRSRWVTKSHLHALAGNREQLHLVVRPIINITVMEKGEKEKKEGKKKKQ